MKKFALGLLALVFSSAALASGKIVVTPRYYRFDKVGGSIGLSVWEPLFAGIAFNGWAGYGIRPFAAKPTEYWLSSNIGLDYQVGPWILGVGVQPQFSVPDGEEDSNVFVKFGRQLW